MKPRWRAALRRAVLTVIALAALTVSGCALPGLQHVGMGVGSYRTTWTVGACHKLDQYVESDQMFASDTTPPVPCTSPHQSETYAVVPITGVVADQAQRPTPDWLDAALRGDCSWSQMEDYLGGGAAGAQRDVTVLQIVPSENEWRDGVRKVRCDALVGPRTPSSIATISQSLKGIMLTPAGARFRDCPLGNTETSCDGLHTTEPGSVRGIEANAVP